MHVSRLSAFLSGSTPTSAVALAEAVRVAEAVRTAAEQKQTELALARQEALLSDDDAKVDAIEAEIAVTSRRLDRAEILVPELRKRQARQAWIEERANNQNAFDAAVKQRIAAATEVDEALSVLGRAFVNLDTAGERLSSLQKFHGAMNGADGAVEVGRASPVIVVQAVKHLAPSFARVIGLASKHGNDGRPFAEVEGAFWNGIQDRVKAKHQANPAPTLEDLE
jgi:hypothetical protein